jgi:chromodomain-helicase-DNA-binding protein 7
MSQGQSYLHVEWLFESDILAERFGKTKLARYYRHPPLVYDEDKPFNPDFVQVDRILDDTVETDDDGNEVTKYLVKWESTAYNESTWELATDINVRSILTSLFTMLSLVLDHTLLILLVVVLCLTGQ